MEIKSADNRMDSGRFSKYDDKNEAIRGKLTALLENLSEGIVEICSGLIVYANPTAISLLGLSLKKLLGSRLPDLFDPSTKQRVESFLTSSPTEPSAIDIGHPVKINHNQLTMKNLSLKDEPSTGIILISDVSDQKAVEEILRKERKDLRERVKKLQERLQQAQKMEAITTLAGGIAHDLNNLMMGIMGNVSLMLYGIDSSHPHFEKLNKIENAIERSSRLTSRLLGYAQKGKYQDKSADPNETARKSILLVDDDEVVIEVSAQILERFGYTVFKAISGRQAIQIYNNTDKIDLVILDMIMPDMGGGETFDRLKAMDPDVKVLLSSGCSIDGRAEEIIKRGCNGFIQKPFGVKQLSDKLREILDTN